MPRHRIAMLVLFACLSAAPAAAGAAESATQPRTVDELFYGEVLYHHYRQDYFTALTRLLVSREQGRIEPGREDTELLRVAIELSYGLHENALQVFRSELDGRVDPQSRDRIWLSLARTWLRRGYPGRAADALQRIGPDAPPDVVAERAGLQAGLLIDAGDYLAAAELLEDVDAPPVWAAYARYNRSVALHRAGQDEDSSALLETLGDSEADDRELQELRDRANIAAGYGHLAGRRTAAAKTAFERIAADSPQAAQARSGLGWIEYQNGAPVDAAALWSDLAQRTVTGSAIPEAPLMIAYAQRRSGAHREALAGYREAIPGYRRELAALENLIAAIRDDQSFALQAAAAGQTGQRAAADVPELYRSSYLYDVIAGDRFQEAWTAWRNLGFVKRHLEDWAMNIAAFNGMLATRRHAYAGHLPAVREQLAELDVAALEAEVAGYHRRLDVIERDDDVFGLASGEQRRIAAEIAAAEARLERRGGIPEFDAYARRLRILKGVLRWDVEQAFIPRLWQSRKGLARLDDALEQVREGRQRLQQAQQQAPARFEGYDDRITGLEQRIAAMQRRVDDAIGRHQVYLRDIAIAGLERQQQRVEGLLARAHYQLATLLDESAAGIAGLPDPATDAAVDDRADGSDPVTAARQRALQAWREFIPLSVDAERRRHAMRRSADLQLMISEAALSDDGGREAGLRMAIRDYQRLLQAYPDYPQRDGVYYQVARAHDNLGEPEQTLAVLTRLVDERPDSYYYDEAQFRRGEILFVQRDYAGAERAYRTLLGAEPVSPFEQQARYKHGWALFKQSRYEAALDDFIAVLDVNLDARPETGSYTSPESLSGARRELASDTLRVIGLSFSNLDGVRSATGYLERRPPVVYEPLIFEGLAELYLEKERYSDAARTFAAFVDRNPDHQQAAAAWLRVLEIYEQAGFTARAFEARQQFLLVFGPRSRYWDRHDLEAMPQVAARIKQELLAMAQIDHARAQHSGAKADYLAAARWYRDYLDAFPGDAESPRLSFLLAELLFDGGAYPEAIERFEYSAYRYPAHPRAAEAGYAALLAHDRHLETLVNADRLPAQQHAWHSALHFAGVFAADPRAPAVLARTAEQQFTADRPARANAVALLVLLKDPPAAPELRRSAWTIAGHVRFDRAEFDGAETAYAQAVALIPAGDPARPQLNERLAATIYQQGRLARDGGRPALAARHFLRVGAAAPAAAIVETAEYDAAAALISAADWDAAIAVLERFRRDFPDSHWRGEVTVKLSTAYLEAGQPGRAAGEFTRLSRDSADPAIAREAAWRAAELYVQAGRTEQSLQAWQRYLEAFPEPFDQAIEARRRLAAAYRDQGDDRRYRHWLNEIIAADAAAGAARTPFSRETAADAALALAEPLRQQFQDIELVIPLDQSLKAKRAAMQRALKGYQQAADYGIAGIATSATFRIGEIYHELSRSLLESQRPAGLSADEREQYDILLEEQAYPFEEEAIELHEVNYRRIFDGIYDQWVKRSLEQLAELLPVRYGKTERKASIIEALH